MRLLCFGDSNTYGYDPRSYLTARYGPDVRWVGRLPENWTVFNEGMNGREIPTMDRWADLDRLFADRAPLDAFTVMLGTNDLLQHHRWTPQDVANRMGLFLRHLLRLPALSGTRLVLIAPPPMVRGAWCDSEEDVQRSRALTACYRQLAADLSIEFLDAGDWHIALSYDGVHFLPEGHRAFAEGITHYFQA